MTPRVSVVLPARDRARTLRRAIRSVLTQTIGELELIVVDDGSTDNTAAYLATIGDARLRVLRIAAGNAAAARNAGIAATRAPLIAFQDSDDEWVALKLEQQIALMDADPALDLVYGGELRWDGARLRRHPSPQHRIKAGGDLSDAVRHRDVVAPPAWLVRRVCFERVGWFDETLPAVEDWEWLLRFSRSGRAGFIDEPLIVANPGEDSLSLNHARVAQALTMIAQKHREQLRPASGALAHVYLAAGVRACLSADAARGRAIFARGLAEQPLAVPLLGAWFLSFLGARVMHAVWRFARQRLA